MPVLSRVPIEPFIVAILAAVVAAAVLPARGTAATVVEVGTTVGIALLFFLYGTRLEPKETLAGLAHWHLHAVVFAFNYLVFPVLGLICRPIVATVLGEDLATGLLYLCLVPSTVQSSITFVSLAKGSVGAAVVSASVSNLLGVFLTPLLVLVLLTGSGTAIFGSGAALTIVVQLLLPFALGQLLRRWVRPVLTHIPRLALFDKTVIVLIVYAAFSRGMVEGIWSQIDLTQILLLALSCLILLAAVLALTTVTAQLFGFSAADTRVIQFCGSKKSLATGLPMAAVLFAGQPVGMVVLPLMLYHQIQLIVCSWLATRYARQHEPQAT